jgi:hypothetical protein
MMAKRIMSDFNDGNGDLDDAPQKVFEFVLANGHKVEITRSYENPIPDFTQLSRAVLFEVFLANHRKSGADAAFGLAVDEFGRLVDRLTKKELQTVLKGMFLGQMMFQLGNFIDSVESGEIREILNRKRKLS